MQATNIATIELELNGTANRAAGARPGPLAGVAPGHRWRAAICPLIAGWLLLAPRLSGAQAEGFVFRSTAQPTPLLELYSSEGCSSCPPAEAWLSRLKTAPGLWRDFVPVAFHVDYWDDLGWRDPWSDRSFSFRQRDYSQLWRTGQVYTPGFVLNGFEWRGWSAAAKLPRRLDGQTGVLTASSADRRRWHVSYRPPAGRVWEYQANAAMLASGLVSDVKAGENRGRRLPHDFVALGLVSETLTNHGGVFLGELAVAPPEGNTNRLALAVWITLPGQLEPLQATGGWLPPTAARPR